MTQLQTTPDTSSTSATWLRYLRAELASHAGRLDVRVTLTVWLVQILCFAYAVQYVVMRSLAAEWDPDQTAATVRALSPAVAGSYVSGSLPGYGIPVFVVLGALVAASDHRWGTLRVLLARCPERLLLLGARFGALVLLCLGAAAATLLAGLAGSWLVTALEGGSMAPSVPDLLGGLVALWLMAVGYATLGFTLGIVLRSPMAATVVGVGWLVGVELLLLGGLAGAVPLVDDLRGLLLTANVGSVAAAADGQGALVGQGLPGLGAVNPGAVAVAAVLAWILAGLAAAAWSLRRRDIG